MNSSLEELKTTINEKDTEISAAAAETVKTFAASEQGLFGLMLDIAELRNDIDDLNLKNQAQDETINTQKKELIELKTSLEDTAKKEENLQTEITTKNLEIAKLLDTVKIAKIYGKQRMSISDDDDGMILGEESEPPVEFAQEGNPDLDFPLRR